MSGGDALEGSLQREGPDYFGLDTFRILLTLYKHRYRYNSGRFDELHYTHFCCNGNNHTEAAFELMHVAVIVSVFSQGSHGLLALAIDLNVRALSQNMF